MIPFVAIFKSKHVKSVLYLQTQLKFLLKNLLNRFNGNLKGFYSICFYIASVRYHNIDSTKFLQLLESKTFQLVSRQSFRVKISHMCKSILSVILGFKPHLPSTLFQVQRQVETFLNLLTKLEFQDSSLLKTSSRKRFSSLSFKCSR